MQVLQFLQHDGYVDTARAFASEIQSEKQSLCMDPSVKVPGIDIKDDEDANNRQRESSYYTDSGAILLQWLSQLVNFIHHFH